MPVFEIIRVLLRYLTLNFSLSPVAVSQAKSKVTARKVDGQLSQTRELRPLVDLNFLVDRLFLCSQPLCNSWNRKTRTPAKKRTHHPVAAEINESGLANAS